MSKLLEQIKIAPKNTKKIGDIVAYIADNRGKNPAYYSEVGIPVIDNFMITGHRAVDLSIARRFIDEETYKSFIRKETRENDILVTLVGNGYGQICLAPKEKSVIIQNTIGLRTDNLNSNFYLFYLLGKYKEKITALDRGAAQPSVKVGDLLDIDIHIPNLPIQNKIANILSAYDYKIENNNKIIKNLELTAQTIFNEWFVNFKFPGYEKAKMANSELGEIPEGWDVGRISDVGDVVCGKTPSKAKPEYFNGDFPFIKIPDMHGQMFILSTEDSLTQEGVNTQKNKLIPEDSICVSCIATVGLVSITTKDSQTNQQINTVVPKNKEFTEYLYFILTNMKSDLQAIGSGGSTTLNVNTSVFSDLEVLIPDDNLIKTFNKKISPFFNQTKQLLKENISLKESRDQLLAKLI